MSYCVCPVEHLCDACYGRELTAKRGQARVLGETWAERVCRGELRLREAWPAREPKTIAIACRLVRHLATDARLVAELAAVCDAGAAGWWKRRPDRYR